MTFTDSTPSLIGRLWPFFAAGALMGLLIMAPWFGWRVPDDTSP